MSVANELIYTVFVNEPFSKLAIEIWSERDLNPQSENSVQTL